VTGDEHETQQIIANIIIECGFEVRHSHLLRLQLSTDLIVFALEACASAEVIDGTILGSGHEPSTGTIGDS
jgi:hypothetical protein